MTEEGVIYKVLSGFYYVKTKNGMLECRARGKMRHDGLTPMTGDKVICEAGNDNKGVVLEIKERKNFFIRPAVANIDLLVFVASDTNPVTDPYLIDRVSVVTDILNCGILICINKTDIEPADDLFDIYSACGIPVIKTSAKDLTGIDELRAAIDGKICAFTGNSGVGKSSLLNVLCPGLNQKVDIVSDKLGRGKHTTRHVELFPLGNDTFVIDTPGFASYELDMLSNVRSNQLQYHFVEFQDYLGKCRFNNCNHINEPDCIIREMVNVGKIHRERYESYCRMYRDLKNDEVEWD